MWHFFQVGNEMRQDGNTRDMIYKLPFLISYISGIMSLEPGDVILTGILAFLLRHLLHTPTLAGSRGFIC